MFDKGTAEPLFGVMAVVGPADMSEKHETVFAGPDQEILQKQNEIADADPEILQETGSANLVCRRWSQLLE